jgi:hypothetical protein
MNSFDYWVQLGISQVWVVVIIAAVSAFGLGMGIMRLIDNRLIATLKERKESAEDRLKKVKGRVATNLLKVFSRELPRLRRR